MTKTFPINFPHFLLWCHHKISFDTAKLEEKRLNSFVLLSRSTYIIILSKLIGMSPHVVYEWHIILVYMGYFLLPKFTFFLIVLVHKYFLFTLNETPTLNGKFSRPNLFHFSTDNCLWVLHSILVRRYKTFFFYLLIFQLVRVELWTIYTRKCAKRNISRIGIFVVCICMSTWLLCWLCSVYKPHLGTGKWYSFCSSNWWACQMQKKIFVLCGINELSKFTGTSEGRIMLCRFKREKKFERIRFLFFAYTSLNSLSRVVLEKRNWLQIKPSNGPINGNKRNSWI